MTRELTSTPPRSSLYHLAVGVGIVVAVFLTRFRIILPYFLSWAIWGLVQRSPRADRRRLAWPIAIPVAMGISKLIATFLTPYTLDWWDALLLGGLPLWLFWRPSKLALWVELVVFSFVSIRVAWMLPRAFAGERAFAEVGSMLTATLFFAVGTAGAAALALVRDRPEVATKPSDTSSTGVFEAEEVSEV